jgi:hypothetical protein
MRFWRRELFSAFIFILLSGLLLGAQFGVIPDEDIVLPTSGTLQERPFFSSRRHPAIGYDQDTTDVVAELSRKVADGTVRLRFEKNNGYLLSVLDALKIPVETQSLLFSKTSLQSHFIAPTNPRALFYSDEVTVGFIRNASLLEIAAFDPKLGVVFYAIEQQPSERPEIIRSDSCLSCHESRNTMDVPGLLLRSMGVGSGGETMPQFGNFVSDHRSPFAERWGGWFITGSTGSVHHMGNVMLRSDGSAVSASYAAKPLTSLKDKFDLDGYPTGYSDVAAVMVLDHQATMTNLLTRVGWETRLALTQVTKDPKEKGTADRLIGEDSRELVDYMLFVDEAPLAGKFESTSGFATTFAAAAPQDSRGRSLKQLDLVKRLMRYPCSYMIYSRAFDELPRPTKEAIYARLWTILSGKDKTPKYSKLSTADRAAIVSILLDTKKDLPKYFARLEK